MACYRQVGMSAVKTLNFFFSKQRTVPLLVALLLPNLTNGNSGPCFLKNDGSLHAIDMWGEFGIGMTSSPLKLHRLKSRLRVSPSLPGSQACGLCKIRWFRLRHGAKYDWCHW